MVLSVFIRWKHGTVQIFSEYWRLVPDCFFITGGCEMKLTTLIATLLVSLLVASPALADFNKPSTAKNEAVQNKMIGPSNNQSSSSSIIPKLLGIGSANAAQSCSTTCGGSSYSASCSGNQTCDCSCNRQPVCQCR